MTTSRPVTRFELQTLTVRDLPAAHALSRAVNWPHRLEDWQFAHALGQGFAAYSGDRLIGTAMWWSYDSRIARLGMVIVDPTIQRSGVGRALMHGVLGRITEPTVLLNATEQGEPLYGKLGFQGVGSIIQHQGTPLSAPLVALRDGARIRPLDRNELAHLIALDAAASGAAREGVIAALIENSETVVLDDAGEMVGFACYRRFGRGHVIGPVIARDAADAKALIAHWVGANAGIFMRIDTHGESGLSNWLETLGLKSVDTVVTMVRGAPVNQASRFHVFGAINQALG